MREIELKKGGACLYRGNDERIDPDTDFSHIDSRIEDALGQYQKEFMGDFSAENLGPRYGGYGTFLPVDLYCPTPAPAATRSQAHISSRSPYNPITEVRPSSTIQANESIPFRPRPGIPPTVQTTLALDNTVNARISVDSFLNSRSKAVPAHHSDNDLPKARQKVGSDNVRDNSAIYNGLGLDMSPSSSLGDSPSDLDGTPYCLQGLQETSPSHIIEVMTSFPVPGGKPLSPLLESLVSLKEKEIIPRISIPRFDTTVKIEHESVPLEVKMTVLKERKVKPINRNEVSEFEKKNCEDPSKRREGSKMSKGKEIVIENAASANDTPLDKKGISRTSLPLVERSEVAQFPDVRTRFPKQPHVKQEPSVEHADSPAFPMASFEEKVNQAASSERIRRDKNVSAVIKSDAGDDNLSQTGFVEQSSKKSKESKKKVKKELKDSFSSQDIGLRHIMPLTQEDTDKSSKQQRKTKSKAEVLPNSTFQEVTEKIHSGRKSSSTVEKGPKDKKIKNEEFDVVQGPKDSGRVASESLEESSSSKNLPRSQKGANTSNRTERLSSEGKKKIRKSREGSQSSIALPKISFRVGSSAALSQSTESGSDFVSHGETHKNPTEAKAKSSDLAGNATLKKKEKVTSTKDSVDGASKRENYASGSKLKDKSESSQYQYPSNAGSNPRTDPTDITHSMEKAPPSSAVPTEIAPVLIQEDWVECDKCKTWRLLPHNIKPDDLPKRWLCSMLTWLPGMNKCSFTEEETRDALRALYQLPPAVNGAQIHQTNPTGGPPVAVAADKQPAGIIGPATRSDPVPDARKKGPKQEVHDKSKMDQSRTLESGNKQKPNQSRSGAGKQVVTGKKREGSNDSHGALKKARRDSQQFAKDQNPVVPLATEIGNTPSKKIKEKTQPIVTNADERKDVPAKKRKLKDWNNGPTVAEIPSTEVPFKERDSYLRKEKRQKLKEANLYVKDKNDGGNQDNASCGGSSRKTGRRDDTSHKTVDRELKMPALAAATSSSSKISSTCRVRVKSQAKNSPVGSISSSPMKVSRSDHDRIRETERELSMVKKKNLEARVVAPDVARHFEERKSKKGADAEARFHPAQEDAVAGKTSAAKQAKQVDDSSRRKPSSVDLGARSVNAENPERVKRKQDEPSSSTQVLLSLEKVEPYNAMSPHDSKGKLPKEPGCGKLVADLVGASSSVRKDNPDRAARTALKEAKDLKHSANRLKINGSGVSTQVFFQAALKFLQGASLLESDNAEGSRCGDMKSSEVYSSTAKLCLYCAHEFEKLNDMASAALAYKCMEVAYMRVVYANDVTASRDRQDLQLAQAEVHQVESPSSSASDVDNVNNLTPNDAAVKATQSVAVRGNYVISAGNRPNFVRLLNFAEDVNLAMDAARRSQNAFAAAGSTLAEAGNDEVVSAIKRVLDFSFHDVDEFLHMVRLAME